MRELCQTAFGFPKGLLGGIDLLLRGRLREAKFQRFGETVTSLLEEALVEEILSGMLMRERQIVHPYGPRDR